MYRKMALCLDLRKMAAVSDYIPPGERANAVKHAVESLVKWLASRFDGSPSTDGMPDWTVVYEQFELLTTRLQQAYSEPAFASWKGASGTVIMKSVFTMQRFYCDCQDYLYLFSHCASKSMCEAVIEGCGGVWDRSARHHPSFDIGTERAVIAWSAPWPWHPAAKVFVNHALADLFKGSIHGHFGHINKQVDRIPAFATAGSSVVMERQAKWVNRLPDHAYDISVLGR